jgi:hypothetical protein
MKPCLIALALAAAPLVLHAELPESSRPPRNGQSTARLRPATPAVRAMVDDAIARSATVRALAREIASSDLIVYVELGRTTPPAVATTRLVTASERTRYVRVTIDALTTPDDLIPRLAHELQHAVEIARHPDVRDATGMKALYARIGLDAREQVSFETGAAQAAERRARAEGIAARNGRRALRQEAR